MGGTADQVLLYQVPWHHIPFCTADPCGEGNAFPICKNADSVHINVFVQCFCNPDK